MIKDYHGGVPIAAGSRTQLLRHLVAASVLVLPLRMTWRTFAKVVAASMMLVAPSCGQRAPAWPKSAGHVAVTDWKDDGGHTIAPTNAAAAMLEHSSDSSVAEPKKTDSTAASVTPGPAAAATPEIIIGDEIIFDLSEPTK
jgi:hypothetical protein